MPSLVVIGLQIKETQRGTQCAPPLTAYMVPKDPSLNRVNHIIDLKYEISTQRLHPVPMLSSIGSKIIIIKYERIGL